MKRFLAAGQPYVRAHFPRCCTSLFACSAFIRFAALRLIVLRVKITKILALVPIDSNGRNDEPAIEPAYGSVGEQRQEGRFGKGPAGGGIELGVGGCNESGDSLDRFGWIEWIGGEGLVFFLLRIEAHG